MRISGENKRLLVAEIRFVASKMRGSDSQSERLFYFSGIHGTVNRIMNSEYDSTLALIHHVLQVAHVSFQNRLQAAERGDPVKLPDEFVGKLTDQVEELGRRVEAGGEVYAVLENIVTLTYVTTGNGYYLYQKGAIPDLSE